MALVSVTPVGHGTARATLMVTSSSNDLVSLTVSALVVILPGLESPFDTHVGTVLPSIVVGLCCICLMAKRSRNTSHVTVVATAASLRYLAIGTSALTVVGCMAGTST